SQPGTLRVAPWDELFVPWSYPKSSGLRWFARTGPAGHPTSGRSAIAEELWRHTELTVCNSLGGRRYNGAERQQNTGSKRGGVRGDRSGEWGEPVGGVDTQPGPRCRGARLDGPGPRRSRE